MMEIGKIAEARKMTDIQRARVLIQMLTGGGDGEDQTRLH
jgi:hypothetical protein